MYSDLSKRHTGWNQASTFPQSGGRSSTSRYNKRPGEPTRRKRSLLKCTIWIFIGLVVVGFLGFAVLNGTSDTSVDEDNSGREVARLEEREASKTVRRENVKNDGEYGPKIKGLRLGMKYDDVKSIVKSLADRFNVDNPQHTLSLDCDGRNAIKLMFRKTQEGCFIFDDEKLIIYGFSDQALCSLFGVSPNTMTFSKFLQIFMDSYGVPNVQTQTYTSTKSSTMGPIESVETLGYYDGSDVEGYAFKGREYRTNFMAPRWSFTVQRYVGLNFDLPTTVDMSYVKNYQHGYGPVVKGLQLGMTREEVIDTVRLFWPDGEYKNIRDGISYSYGNGPGLTFTFKNGRVDQFIIECGVLETLFNVDSKYYPFKDFAQRTINHYGIPLANGERQSSSGAIRTTYRNIQNGIEFYIGEYRTREILSWAIKLHRTDSFKFD